MATLREKLIRLEQVRARVEAAVEAGLDLKSPEAVPIGMEFIRAANDVAEELGHGFIKPIEDKKDDDSKQGA